jgi:hypothetical protein
MDGDFRGTGCGMDTVKMGQAGLKGWRGKVADVVAPPVSRHAPVTDEQIRAVVGGLFFVLAVVYVVGVVKQLLDRR